jgi:hypothetical protein
MENCLCGLCANTGDDIARRLYLRRGPAHHHPGMSRTFQSVCEMQFWDDDQMAGCHRVQRYNSHCTRRLVDNLGWGFTGHDLAENTVWFDVGSFQVLAIRRLWRQTGSVFVRWFPGSVEYASEGVRRLNVAVVERQADEPFFEIAP